MGGLNLQGCNTWLGTVCRSALPTLSCKHKASVVTVLHLLGACAGFGSTVTSSLHRSGQEKEQLRASTPGLGHTRTCRHTAAAFALCATVARAETHPNPFCSASSIDVPYRALTWCMYICCMVGSSAAWLSCDDGAKHSTLSPAYTYIFFNLPLCMHRTNQCSRRHTASLNCSKLAVMSVLCNL